MSQDQSTATGTPSSNVVFVIATSGDAKYSADVVPNQFVDWRFENITSRISGAIDAITKLARYKGAEKETAGLMILAQRLQDLQILKDTATGNFRWVPATVPESPIAPKPLRSAILGVGLLAGIGLAFLLEQFDTRCQNDVAALLRRRCARARPRLVTLEHPRDPSQVFGTVAHQPRPHERHRQSLFVDRRPAGRGQSITIADLAVTRAPTRSSS